MASTTETFAQRHRPDPHKTSNGRWRMDCSCGWRGPVVALPGQGHEPWAEHFYVTQMIEEVDRQHAVDAAHRAAGHTLCWCSRWIDPADAIENTCGAEQCLRAEHEDIMGRVR